MALHFILGKHYELPHTNVNPGDIIFNVVPHLNRARTLADLYEEPIAIYRYLDKWPNDVFVNPLQSLDEAYRRQNERLVVEAVVNPRRA